MNFLSPSLQGCKVEARQHVCSSKWGLAWWCRCVNLEGDQCLLSMSYFGVIQHKRKCKTADCSPIPPVGFRHGRNSCSNLLESRNDDTSSSSSMCKWSFNNSGGSTFIKCSNSLKIASKSSKVPMIVPSLRYQRWPQVRCSWRIPSMMCWIPRESRVTPRKDIRLFLNLNWFLLFSSLVPWQPITLLDSRSIATAMVDSAVPFKQRTLGQHNSSSINQVTRQRQYFVWITKPTDFFNNNKIANCWTNRTARFRTPWLGFSSFQKCQPFAKQKLRPITNKIQLLWMRKNAVLGNGRQRHKIVEQSMIVQID